MYKIDAAGSVDPKPTPAALGTEGFFANPGVNPGTTVDADFANMLQESLIAVLDDRSVAHSKTDSTKLLEAIQAIVDAKFAAIDIGLPGYESGLEVIPDNTGTTFNVGDGMCRDFANSATMRSASGFTNLDASVDWNEGVGTLASSITWADFIHLRVFAIGKAGTDEMNIGCDFDPAAVNLLSDAAGDGWDLYRQIGWVSRYLGTTLRNWQPVPGQKGLYICAPENDDPSNSVSFSTSATNLWMDVPAGTLHIGAWTLNPNSAMNAVTQYANIGNNAAPAVPTAALHNFAYRPSNSQNSDAMIIWSEMEDRGFGTLTSQLSMRFTNTAMAGTVHTLGFFWSRELL